MRAKFIKTEIERRQTSWINEQITTTEKLAEFAENLPDVEYVDTYELWEHDLTKIYLPGYYDTGVEPPELVLKEGGDLLTYRNLLITLIPE